MIFFGGKEYRVLYRNSFVYASRRLRKEVRWLGMQLTKFMLKLK